MNKENGVYEICFNYTEQSYVLYKKNGGIGNSHITLIETAHQKILYVFLLFVVPRFYTHSNRGFSYDVNVETNCLGQQR